MDNILIKSVQVLYPGSPYHQQSVDVHLKRGKILEVAKNILPDEKEQIRVVDGLGQYLTPGFLDLNANLGEPGFETKEDVESGTKAAFAGGFNAVAVHPNTNPPLHRHSEVALVRKRSEGLPVDVYPIGTVSKKRQGAELAELYDMRLAGARAFSDGDQSISDAGLMGRALLYSKGIGSLIVSFADDRNISLNAPMNEGVMSTYLGMKGNPALAEALMVARDLYLAEYHQTRIHFTTISTAESVQLIKEAKAKGMPVTCDVAAHHLVLTDESIIRFDSLYKVHPPLRTIADIDALRKGLEEGVVDAIVSQHTPHEIEHKRLEFQLAKNGIAGFQTVLPMVLEAGFTSEQIVEHLAIQPRKILDIPLANFEKGSVASFILFDPKKEWVYSKETNFSKSTNNPYFEKKLTGCVTFAINKRQIYTSNF